ncbi:hypothetical protein KIPB_003292 [Kipferlia bialata]|uniref:Uncharacterized protein n=1 Tax=Kipferlia bialata TaxID=797122 RepID=A0A9K3GFN6_9EUKA|nr:hypothetical protein KIPB_003292 [Kipferlia bialata]|eukprot:g3292.t1
MNDDVQEKKKVTFRSYRPYDPEMRDLMLPLPPRENVAAAVESAVEDWKADHILADLCLFVAHSVSSLSLFVQTRRKYPQTRMVLVSRAGLPFSPSADAIRASGTAMVSAHTPSGTGQGREREVLLDQGIKDGMRLRSNAFSFLGHLLGLVCSGICGPSGSRSKKDDPDGGPGLDLEAQVVESVQGGVSSSRPSKPSRKGKGRKGHSLPRSAGTHSVYRLVSSAEGTDDAAPAVWVVGADTGMEDMGDMGVAVPGEAPPPASGSHWGGSAEPVAEAMGLVYDM